MTRTHPLRVLRGHGLGFCILHLAYSEPGRRRLRFFIAPRYAACIALGWGLDTARSPRVAGLSRLPSKGGNHTAGLWATPRGATRRARTADLLVTNQLLYRLSYTSTSG